MEELLIRQINSNFLNQRLGINLEAVEIKYGNLEDSVGFIDESVIEVTRLKNDGPKILRIIDT